MKTECNFALIGTGAISNVHAGAISHILGASLVAVASRREEKAKEFANQFKVIAYTDHLKMLQRDDIDIVNICTPSGTHGDLAIDVLRSGKHVIIEKPMDVSLEKAEKIIQLATELGLKVAVVSQHRFDLSVIRVKKEIESGRLGRLILAEIAVNWYRNQDYYDSGQWRGTWNMDGGGALMIQSIHTIDLMQYLMGPVENVYAYTDKLAHERIEVEDVAVAVVRFKNGALGTINCTTAAYPGYSNRIELFGSKGSAVIDANHLTHLYLNELEENGVPINSAPSHNAVSVTGPPILRLLTVMPIVFNSKI
ncbi:Gfo/Idh/MocA family oxidoreductase [Neobacillus pocheonensis]|uniref:Gfo/Idh/MocA family oxidoreductase n=1 Tax=Neobacillus pocheonensis TaxID=363869 RepID=A0ABT0WBX1_9BACI|nr:Gfo/Idh/MocA family oxidoreductase [Neobacillus pocheonensis]